LAGLKKEPLVRANWWKAIAVILVFYTIVMGFLGSVPRLAILHETIRNLYFHVTMWFGMMILLIVNLVYGIKYLSGSKLVNDIYAEESARTAFVFGIAGLLTGMIWANYTWGAPWVNDPQLNGAAGTMLAYAAYFILRNAIPDEHRRAKLSAIYSIFAFVMMIVFLQVLPKVTDTLHPGSGGNPGFRTYDLDSDMRLVFYPAIIGWTLFGTWIMSLRVRLKLLTNNKDT
jgi:heme exporter protein C